MVATGAVMFVSVAVGLHGLEGRGMDGWKVGGMATDKNCIRAEKAV